MKKLVLLIQIKLINSLKKLQYIILAKELKINLIAISLVLKIFPKAFIKIKFFL